MSLLEIKNLNVRFGDAKAVPVVDGLSLSVDRGEVLAIVGESGSGKSVTMMALMGLIDSPGIITADALNFDGNDLLKLNSRQRRRIIGKDLAMVFQDPMTALNPSYTVGFQIEEVLRQHLNMSGKAARQRALELLEKVEIPGAAARLNAYPHQLSGGMSQRVAIAMAIAGEPKLLIADEPTTALDVT
ncbi:dipeptide ABC transporter ATP-binding protein DppD, partial [Pseudomonas syringae pv. actinidiae]|nr:dipeptide ABC transporter ATP-binding protein DppD [Pseudomonas syringae pv. actinidiae]